MSALTKITNWEYKLQSNGDSDTFVEGYMWLFGWLLTQAAAPALQWESPGHWDSTSCSYLWLDSRWQQREALHIPAGSSLHKGLLRDLSTNYNIKWQKESLISYFASQRNRKRQTNH